MDLQRLAEIAEAHNLWVISDEVYEHIIFDDEEHQSAMLIESLKERSFINFFIWKNLSQYRLESGLLCGPRKH